MEKAYGFASSVESAGPAVPYYTLGNATSERTPNSIFRSDTTYSTTRGQVVVWPEQESYQADAVGQIWDKQMNASCGLGMGNYPVYASDNYNPFNEW
jgi:hypothetical protein